MKSVGGSRFVILASRQKLFYRAKASHSWLPEDERLKLGITEDYIRLSVGLESAKALIQDLDQALRRAVPIWI